MKRGVLIVIGALLVLGTAWLAATEAGFSTGGLPRAAAATVAKNHVSSTTPIKEEASIAGPYLVLGWTIRDATNPFAIVWRVSLKGVFEGHCLPSEANICLPATVATVVINYFNGGLVTVFYDG